MAATTIQEFLVGLSWKLDENSQRKFSDALVGGKVAAVALAGALTGLVATIAKVAEGYEQLYYASQRTGATAGNMQALAYAVSQVGGSAAGAASSLEAVGRFLRTSPGAESFIARLGVQTRDASGNLRDTTALLTDLGARFRTMPYYRANAYAGVLGIDERTLQALIRGTGQFSEQLKAMYRAAGVDATAAAKGSAVFMQQLRGLGAALQVLRDKVALSLEHGVGGDIDRLRKLLVDNFGRISAVIVEVSQFVVRLGDALVRLSGRAAELIGPIVDWFDHLDTSNKKWIETIGLTLFAWRALSKGILATPLGRTLAAFSALLLLFDDFRTWKEGGKSAIDWSKWIGDINDVEASVKKIQDAFKDMAPIIKGYLAPLVDYLKNDLVLGMKEAMADLADLVQAADDLLHRRWSAAAAHLGNVASRAGASEADDMVRMGAITDNHGSAAGGLLSRAWNYLSGNLAKQQGTGYGILRGLGLDRVHALAMLGNFQEESGLRPGAIGPDGHHYGIEQWSDERADKILAGTHIDVRTASYADQLKAAVWELFNSQSSHARPFLASRDLTGAAAAFADPHAVGKAVAKQQDWVVASLVRNMGPLNR